MFVAKQCEGDSKIKKYLSEHKEDKLNSFEESGKLLGLVELLTECDIIETKKSDSKEEIKQSDQTHSENLLMDMAN